MQPCGVRRATSDKIPAAGQGIAAFVQVPQKKKQSRSATGESSVEPEHSKESPSPPARPFDFGCFIEINLRPVLLAMDCSQ